MAEASMADLNFSNAEDRAIYRARVRREFQYAKLLFVLETAASLLNAPLSRFPTRMDAIRAIAARRIALATGAE